MKTFASLFGGLLLVGVSLGANAQSTGSTVVLQCSSSSGGTCTATGDAVPQSNAVRTYSFIWRGENITMTPIDGKSVNVQCIPGQIGKLTATSSSTVTISGSTGSAPAGEASATVTIDCSNSSAAGTF
ncbi:MULTISPECIES: hypothetical protein [Burkholderia]|uniref:hypothetical protein n=1 Tax=Burkholderia TaxID=32008 RepID=UPI001362D26D|nr:MULTISPECIES: hypothetical protein [Burkholderia]